MKSDSFFSELKRRNVYKVAVAYAVVSWLLIQIATQVFPFFEIPNWAVRLVVIVLILGFPIALALSWAFEITPEGIKRESEVAPDQSIAHHTGRKLVGITIAVAVLAAGLMIYRQFRPKSAETAAVMPASSPSSASTSAQPAPDKSIAVLPFENLSSDKENAYFADGIQDEILTRLSKITALKVISRTSTQKYKSAPDNLREVGRQLGVANLVEGSVQKVANAVHVNVQLIRAGTDEHLWAESYNRKLDDIFAVEGEVAGAIADQLQAKLTGSEKQELAAKPTSKPEAYDAYLRGLGMYRKNDDPGLTSAENFLKQAVQLDPDFALAWALLSRVHAIRFFNGDEVTEARRAAARQAVDQAVRLQPDLAEVQLAQGYYQYWVERDYDAAGHRFADLSAKWPNNAEILEALGLILRRQGHWEEGGAYLDRAVALDPLSLSPRLNAIDVKIFTRDLPGAMKRVNEALDIWPDNAAFLADKALIHLVLGQFDQAESVVASLHPQPTDFAAILAIRNVAQARRSYSSAITQVKALLETNQAKSPNDFNSGFLHFTLADLQRLAGDTAEAAKNYTQARDEALRLLKDQPDNSALYDVLAFSQAGLGDREAAVKSMDKAVSLVPLAKDALQGVIWETDRALLEARLGDRDRAIPDLEHLLKIPGYLNPEILRYSPDFDPIRDDPRFQKLCQEPGK